MRVSCPWSLSLVASAVVMAQTVSAVDRVSNAEICATAKDRYFRSEPVEIDCNEKFHHYNTGAVERYYKKKKKHEIRIAGFNVFHLGDNQSRFKDFAVMADIMNQWDVVAAVEVQPLPKAEGDHNTALAEYIANLDDSSDLVSEDGTELTLEEIYANFIPTGYIRLLKELRALDPSWALVLAPEGEGEGTHTELTGMYYRARNVKPVETKICGGEIGCPSRYTAEVAPAVERNPFVASFQAGNFDFTLMGVHLRFREPTDSDTMDLLKKIFNGPEFGIKPNKEIARWAELKTVLEFVGKAAADEEKDLIVVGDYNLEHGEREEAAWTEVLPGLPGAVSYLNTPTSISKLNGLASSYDHFVLNPENTSECDMETAASFNFMDAEAYPRIGDELDRQETRLEEYVEQARTMHTIDRGKYVPMYDEAGIADIADKYEDRVIKSQKNKKTPYLVYMELVSDHIPVSVKCSGSAKDDD